MKKRFVRFLIPLAVLIIGIFLGITVLITPAPVEGAETGFSAYRAAKHLETIAKAPHTLFDTEEIANVRNYLKGQLEAAGCTAELKDYQVEGYDITNVYGTLKGTSGEDALLLVAHYDSNPGKGIGEAPGSHGAADDGYGVSVILETLRALKAQGPVKNTIYVAFTDGEEINMLGAKAAAGDTGFAGLGAKAVMNIEGRGLRGPAIMFETSVNNEELVRFFAAHAGVSATWSIASDVYRIMPNYTDFTSFIETGMQGLNFSNLDNLSENHTPLDKYENISLSSIQGYGNQLLPVVSAFAYGDLPGSFASDGDMTFFTPISGVLITYPSYVNYIVLAASAIVLAVYICFAIKKKLLKPSRLLFALTAIGLALAAAAAGELLAFLLSLIFGVPFKPTNMPQIPFQGGIAIIAVGLVGIGLFFIIRRLLKRGWRYEELVAGTLLAFLILQGVFAFALPGGAFLLGWGCLAGAAFGIAALYLPNAFRPLVGFVAVWIAAPVVALLHVSLTIGALGAVTLFAALPFMLMLPSLTKAALPPEGIGQ